MKVFTELTPECDITAQMYAAGYEKKEIAVLKHRAVSTINNQLQTAFLIFGCSEWEGVGIKVSREDIRYPVDAGLFAGHEIICCLCTFDYSLC